MRRTARGVQDGPYEISVHSARAALGPRKCASRKSARSSGGYAASPLSPHSPLCEVLEDLGVGTRSSFSMSGPPKIINRCEVTSVAVGSRSSSGAFRQSAADLPRLVASIGTNEVCIQHAMEMAAKTCPARRSLARGDQLTRNNNGKYERTAIAAGSPTKPTGGNRNGRTSRSGDPCPPYARNSGINASSIAAWTANPATTAATAATEAPWQPDTRTTFDFPQQRRCRAISALAMAMNSRSHSRQRSLWRHRRDFEKQHTNRASRCRGQSSSCCG